MPLNPVIQTRQTVASASHYRRASPGEIQPGAARQFFFDPPAYGFPIHLNLPPQGIVHTNWHRCIALQNDPFPIFSFVWDGTPLRYLTTDEQNVMYRALRRSVRIIREPTP
jgi:hypothetical protein